MIIAIPLWVAVAVPVTMWVLSAAFNAMSMTDRTFYGWLFRFGRLLTASAPALERELHIPVIPPFPTQADVNDPSAQTKS